MQHHTLHANAEAGSVHFLGGELEGLVALLDSVVDDSSRPGDLTAWVRLAHRSARHRLAPGFAERLDGPGLLTLPDLSGASQGWVGSEDPPLAELIRGFRSVELRLTATALRWPVLRGALTDRAAVWVRSGPGRSVRGEGSLAAVAADADSYSASDLSGVVATLEPGRELLWRLNGEGSPPTEAQRARHRALLDVLEGFAATNARADTRRLLLDVGAVARGALADPNGEPYDTPPSKRLLSTSRSRSVLSWPER